jgi:hypothetical protein
MIAKIGQKLTEKLTDLMGTCDKYLWCQMGYSDPEKKLPFQDSDLWVAIPMGFSTDQLMSTHEFL